MAKASSIEDLLKQARQANAAKAAAASPKPNATTTTTAPAKPAAKPQATTKVAAALEEKMGEIKTGEKEKLVQEQSAKTGVPYIALRGFPIAPEALTLITKDTAATLRVIPFYLIGDEVRLGTTNPGKDIDQLAESIRKDRHANVGIYLISDDSFEYALKLYEKLPVPKEVIYGYRIEQADIAKYEKEINDFKDLQKKIGEVSTTDVITLMFGAALKIGSSDVHVEAEEEDVKIRFRVDGRLRDAASLPKAAWKQMISRLKLLAGVKINVEDVPQDGRITIYLTNEKIDIRVSFLPTAFGESVVLRILRPKAIALEFDKLGIRGKALEDLVREIEKPNGMIITTGPTGSGKTTTLYAILKKLNEPTVKIITLEDPIEYKLQGINQSQIEHERGYDFAKGLRSILRQDPDIVMVGEIRDGETAEIAIQAALTGHLVVSTIHTNSAAGAIPRFLSMGVKPFLLAPALNAVIGQRLVRRLTKETARPAKLTAAKMNQVKRILGAIPKNSGYSVDVNKLSFMEPDPEKLQPGDDGYSGRVGIYEIFTMTNEIEEEVLKKDVSEARVEEMATANGMITMAQDGLLKALDGLTSVDEVLEVANTDSEVAEPGTNEAKPEEPKATKE